MLLFAQPQNIFGKGAMLKVMKTNLGVNCELQTTKTQNELSHSIYTGISARKNSQRGLEALPISIIRVRGTQAQTILGFF